MRSTNPSTLPSIDSASADLAGPLRRWLAGLCRNRHQHARFLNMLALLEHIGSRKIMVSQSGHGPLGCEVLKHLSEEARHAYFFKRVAEKVAGRTLAFGEADVLAPTAAKMYFGRLDAGINRLLGRAHHVETPYLYVTLMIELRAIWAYGVYHQVLTAENTGISLKSVLAEEELHLPQMLERLRVHGEDVEARLPAFIRLEDPLFRRFFRALTDGSPVH